MKFTEPNWPFWSKMKVVSLQQAIALSLDFEPADESLRAILDKSFFHPDDELQEAVRVAGKHFRGRLRIAWSNIEEGVLKTKGAARNSADAGRHLKVSLPEFVKWCDEVELDIPEAMATPACSQIGLNSSDGKWPWGEHTTNLLEHLSAAASEFWAGYDSNAKHNAPKSEVVRDWLIDRGVSKTAAEVMAQILRAEDVPQGPRTKK